MAPSGAAGQESQQERRVGVAFEKVFHVLALFFGMILGLLFGFLWIFLLTVFYGCFFAFWMNWYFLGLIKTLLGMVFHFS